MKNKLAMVIIFLITYIGFLIATLPTSFVLNQLDLGKNISKQVTLTGVNGTVWHTKIAQVIINGSPVEKVEARLNFWSLFTLTPELAVTFGDEFNPGPEGKFNLSLTSNTATLSNLTLQLTANEIAQQLPLPLPMTAQGNVELTLFSAEIDLTKNNQCMTATGNAAWTKAGINALERNVPLGKLTAEINCEQGVLAVVISPQNNLGLTFTALVQQSGKVSGNGYLKPGTKFPSALNDALPFLGNKDNQGRYRLVF